MRFSTSSRMSRWLASRYSLYPRQSCRSPWSSGWDTDSVQYRVWSVNTTTFSRLVNRL